MIDLSQCVFDWLIRELQNWWDFFYHFRMETKAHYSVVKLGSWGTEVYGICWVAGGTLIYPPVDGLEIWSAPSP